VEYSLTLEISIFFLWVLLKGGLGDLGSLRWEDMCLDGFGRFVVTDRYEYG